MGSLPPIPRFERVAPGRYEVRLAPDERTLLGNLCGQLGELLEETTDDPSVRRLFPTAYHEDVERDREYQQLVRDELLTRRLAALTTIQATLGADELDQASLTAWMGGLNDLRLVLGTRLDISEDDTGPDPDDPDAPSWYVYGYLTELLADVVDALEDGLGDEAIDAR
jgi:hypothetical protein